jgi:Cu/Ag efflux protein CusF
MGTDPNSPKPVPNNVTATASRHVLPSDLPAAIKYLNDQELDQLQAAVTAEQQRRGKKPPVSDRTPSKRLDAAAVSSLTPGKLNAVRAAGATDELKVQDGLLFNALQAGDKVVFTVTDIGGVRTITKLQKQ